MSRSSYLDQVMEMASEKLMNNNKGEDMNDEKVFGKWVSVEIELPKSSSLQDLDARELRSSPVLITTDGGNCNIYVAQYHSRDKAWRSLDGLCKKVTHWMPKPELPKKKKKHKFSVGDIVNFCGIYYVKVVELLYEFEEKDADYIVSGADGKEMYADDEDLKPI